LGLQKRHKNFTCEKREKKQLSSGTKTAIAADNTKPLQCATSDAPRKTTLLLSIVPPRLYARERLPPFPVAPDTRAGMFPFCEPFDVGK
jgi:hypothetical protein